MKLPRIILTVVLVSATITFCKSQSEYKVAAGSTTEVLGTSTLHDWEMVSGEVKGRGTFTLSGDQVIVVKDLIITTVAETLKSGKGGLDKNAYEALNTSEYPEIKFVLTRTTTSNSTDNGTSLMAYGDLIIAGVTRPVEILSECIVSSKSISCSGLYSTKMTLFKVDPPTAIFGTVKTGDDIQIKFNLSFEK